VPVIVTNTVNYAFDGARAVSARSGHVRKGRVEVSLAALDHSGALRPETGRAPGPACASGARAVSARSGHLRKGRAEVIWAALTIRACCDRRPVARRTHYGVAGEFDCRPSAPNAFARMASVNASG
jgi:hypothetical protein